MCGVCVHLCLSNGTQQLSKVSLMQQAHSRQLLKVERKKKPKHLQLEPLSKIKLEHELRLQILAVFQDVFFCLGKSKFVKLTDRNVMRLISRVF